jgi:hypothetical protein
LTLCLVCAYALADGIAVQLLHVLALDAATRPFRGVIRLAYHAETCLVLGWPAALAAASWGVFSPKRAHYAWPAIGGVFLGAVAGLALAFPLPRGWTAPILHGIEGTFAVAALSAAPFAWGRTWSASERGVLALAGTELSVCLAGAWARDPFRDWEAAQWSYSLGFFAVCCLLARAVRRRA